MEAPDARWRAGRNSVSGETEKAPHYAGLLALAALLFFASATLAPAQEGQTTDCGMGGEPADAAAGDAGYTMQAATMPAPILSAPRQGFAASFFRSRAFYTVLVDNGTTNFTQLVSNRSPVDRTQIDSSQTNGAFLSPIAAGLQLFLYSSTVGATTSYNIFSAGTITTLLQVGQPVPVVGGTISSAKLGFEKINLVGPYAKIVERIVSGNGGSLIRADNSLNGGGQATIVSTNDSMPGPGGNFASLHDQTMNNGIVAFVGENSGSGKGIYTGAGGALTSIANTSQVAPTITHAFNLFFAPAINSSGSAAFVGINTQGKSAIYTGAGGALATIAASTITVAPDIGGTFSGFGGAAPGFNDAGTLAFLGNSANGSGIFSVVAGAISRVASTNMAAPHLTGNFFSFGSPGLAQSGTAIFTGHTNTNNEVAIYLGDSRQLITAAYTGQALAGSAITQLAFYDGPNVFGNVGWNDAGQIGYTAALANNNTGVYLFTPFLHFRGPGNTWDGAGNWTVGLVPDAVHDVFFDPATALTITGPAAATVLNSLTINCTGADVAEIDWGDGPITTTNGVTVGAQGKLSGHGTLNGPLDVAAGGLVTNSVGTLTVNGNLTNSGTMRFTSGSALALGVGSSYINNGLLDVISGTFTPDVNFINTGVVLDSSVVKIASVAKSAAAVTINIAGFTGHTYQLQRSSNLSPGSFAFIGLSQPGNTGATLIFIDNGATNTSGFYRVGVD